MHYYLNKQQETKKDGKATAVSKAIVGSLSTVYFVCELKAISVTKCAPQVTTCIETCQRIAKELIPSKMKQTIDWPILAEFCWNYYYTTTSILLYREFQLIRNANPWIEVGWFNASTIKPNNFIKIRFTVNWTDRIWPKWIFYDFWKKSYNSTLQISQMIPRYIPNGIYRACDSHKNAVLENSKWRAGDKDQQWWQRHGRNNETAHVNLWSSAQLNKWTPETPSSDSIRNCRNYISIS